LVLSLMINLFLTGKDASDWWSERSAANFMRRLGVGPNLVMSKAVYVKDLDDAFSPISIDFIPGIESEVNTESRCYTSFMSVANVTDMDTSYQYAGQSFSEAATRSTARRLRRTRQHLGTYRHDLLVAMRVVNGVEREMLRAEWENWVLDEVSRCRQVGLMLAENRSPASASSTVSRKSKDNESNAQEILVDRERATKIENLRKWHEEYCGSCMREQEKLFAGGKTHVATG